MQPGQALGLGTVGFEGDDHHVGLRGTVEVLVFDFCDVAGCEVGVFVKDHIFASLEGVVAPAVGAHLHLAHVPVVGDLPHAGAVQTRHGEACRGAQVAVVAHKGLSSAVGQRGIGVELDKVEVAQPGVLAGRESDVEGIGGLVGGDAVNGRTVRGVLVGGLLAAEAAGVERLATA